MTLAYKGLKCVGFEQITVSTTSIGFTDAKLKPPTDYAAGLAEVVVETANVRFRDDNTDPTASAGTPLVVGQTRVFDCDLTKVHFIRSGAADATLNVHYYSVHF